MTKVASRERGKYKNALILMPKEVGAEPMTSGCVGLDTGVELTTTSTVDEGSGGIGKRFALHFSPVQHSATQRAKYTERGRVPFLWLQAEVSVQLPAVAGKQPRMPTDVPFFSSAVNAMHLKINKTINTSQSNAALRTPKTKKQFL